MCELSQKIEVRGSWNTKLVLVMELSTLMFSFLTSQKKFVEDLALCGLSTLKSSCASCYSKVGGEIIVGHFFKIYKIHV
jgi:hypothetical protein